MEILRLDKANFEHFEELCSRLYQKIRDSGYDFSWIVDIRRGGAVVGRVFADYFHTKKITGIMFDSEYSPDRSRKYPVIDQKLRPEVRDKIGDDSILVLDDVAEEGLTQREAEKYLREEEGISALRIGCLHVKPQRVYTPHYWVEETSAWVVYPVERNETIAKLLKLEEAGKVEQCTVKRNFTLEEIEQALQTKRYSDSLKI